MDIIIAMIVTIFVGIFADVWGVKYNLPCGPMVSVAIMGAFIMYTIKAENKKKK